MVGLGILISGSALWGSGLGCNIAEDCGAEAHAGRIEKLSASLWVEHAVGILRLKRGEGCSRSLLFVFKGIPIE